MADSNTVVTTQSYFSRIGNSIKGIGIGVILFIVAFPLLFWNEGRAVKTAKALKEGAKTVISVASDKVDPANQDKLIHFTGKTATVDMLMDPIFQINYNGIVLRRKVEMFQWVENASTETKKKVGGSEEKTTTYTYAQEWNENAVDSSNFYNKEGHINPPMNYKAEKYVASHVTVGAFILPENMISSIGGDMPFAIDEAAAAPVLTAIPNAYRLLDGTGYYVAAGDAIGTPAGCAPKVVAAATQTVGAIVNGLNNVQSGTQTAQQAGNTIANAAVGTTRAPVVGDMRISFFVVPQQKDVSIIAKQNGNTLASYQITKDRSLQMLQNGVKTADEMFTSAQKGNTMITWLLRIIGFFVMFTGLKMVFGPLGVLADVLPFLGSLVRMGTGLLSFLIALPCSLVTIAIAWIVYRPVLGVILLVVAVGAIVMLFKNRKSAAVAA
ncbi:MAG: TMEM43 family protein [Victivallales bacterium]|nr:TMEM43 family protein [Victivallales bacterium]